MPEITFWSLERINHSRLGWLMLSGCPQGLMALCVFGLGFPNFFLLLRGFFRGFYESFFLYFFLFQREVLWVFGLKIFIWNFSSFILLKVKVF